MRSLLFFLLLGTMSLHAAGIMVHTPTIQFVGKRVVNRRIPMPGGGAAVEKVQELGYRFIFALLNTSPNTVKLPTGFNHIKFESEPGKNQFVLHLSHNLMSVKPLGSEKSFPLLLPLESFRIVTLRHGEGTLLTVTCWVPEGKVRAGDKLVIEYAPRNFGRYDFMQLKIRSKAVEFKLPEGKKVAPVVI